MSASKLWTVTIEYTLVVVADNERKAESEAEYNAGKDGTVANIIGVEPVRFIEDAPKDWQDSIPFGGDRKDQRTCRQRLQNTTKTPL